MRLFSSALALALAVSASLVAQASQGARAVPSLYDFKTNTLLGQPADLGDYRGKVTLVVNTASYCGYTPQYKGLEALHRELSPKGFAVLGFPSNDFGEQEPGSSQEIAEFCKLTYDVTFPMFSKVVTRPGPGRSPVYSFLSDSGYVPIWNFGKYLISKEGQVLRFFPSDMTPESPELRKAVADALSK
jgi:glutathione peroxidase